MLPAPQRALSRRIAILGLMLDHKGSLPESCFGARERTKLE
jgi:hypothetical protein